MTMTPDQLRALADALEPMARAPRFENFDVPAFCAWVRACADAEPVARIYTDAEMVHRDERWGRVQWIEPESELAEGTLLYAHPAPVAPAGWKLVPVEPTPEMLSAVGMMDGYDWHAPGCSPDADHANWYSAMLAAAPAAPQAGPCIGNDPICPCQDGDACHYKDAADGTKAWPAPQAEPKRDPLHGLAPTHRCPACGAFWRQCDDASWNLRSASCCGLCDAGRVELVRLLDEPKREPSLGELMREQRQSRIVAGAYPDGNPNAGAMMAQTRQAEPKRGLTCLWSRADDDTDMWETSCGHAFTIIDGTPSDNHMGFCCYCGRRVDEEIGGSDAE
jgi:hypothetical protein